MSMPRVAPFLISQERGLEQHVFLVYASHSAKISSFDLFIQNPAIYKCPVEEHQELYIQVASKGRTAGVPSAIKVISQAHSGRVGGGGGTKKKPQGGINPWLFYQLGGLCAWERGKGEGCIMQWKYGMMTQFVHTGDTSLHGKNGTADQGLLAAYFLSCLGMRGSYSFGLSRPGIFYCPYNPNDVKSDACSLCNVPV